MGQYIEYLRKSQLDKDFAELSVEETLKRHQARLDEFTTRNKINVSVVLKEVVTGESLAGRPQMMKALELINSGEYDGIVCIDLDRLSRGSSLDSGYIMQVLQVNNCKILTPDKVYDLQNESDEQFADMKFMFSRYELKTITKRLVAGRNASASEGKYLGGGAPYGYDVIKLKGEKGNSLTINPDEAKVVQMIYDMYTNEGVGYNTIAHRLNLMHLKTKTGRAWTQTSVIHVLTNVIYIGKIRWKYSPQDKKLVDGKIVKKRNPQKNYEVHEGRHEAIITDEQFDLAQKIRKTKTHPSVVIKKEIMNPFAEIMVCEKCGGAMKRNTYGQRVTTKPRFRCPNQGRGCDCKGHQVQDVEEAVVTAMRDWLNQYILTIDTEEVKPKDDLNVALEMLQKELKDLQEQQNNICELLETKVYTVQMFTKRNTALQADIDRIEQNITDLEEQIAVQQNEQVVKSNIIPTTQHLLDSYDELTPRERNDIWKEVLHKITYYKADRGDDFQIKIYPKLPHGGDV